MKKILALILAAMLVLSCTVALATTTYDTDYGYTDGDQEAKAKGTNPGASKVEANNKTIETADVKWMDESSTNADMDVGVDVRYSKSDEKNQDHATAKTEMWLQVDATGQIDVTVPLVVVFQTNIDGGSATSPSAYRIINYSSANLCVTKIEVSAEAKATGTNPMTLKAYSTETLVQDEYKAQLTAKGQAGKKEGGTESVDLKFDMLTTKAYENPASRGGLFQLAKGDTDGKTGNTSDKYGTITDMEFAMSTGKLSFVTKQQDNGDIDYTKGVKLLTVTYTIAIDTQDAIGAAVTTTSLSN